MVASNPQVQTLFNEKLPGIEVLSDITRNGLAQYLAAGNQAHRQKQLREFFQLLDWLAYEELDFSKLSRLEPRLLQQLKRELRHYYHQKQASRAKQQQQQVEYKHRVDAYFRETVSTADKELLESLRDYELNLTHRDVNWQHHFRFKSFKRIDAFAKASHLERMALFEAFYKDVQAYIHNKQKWENAFQQQGGFDFNAWADAYSEQPEAATQNRQQKQQAASQSTQAQPLQKALAFFNCQLTTTNWLEVKQRFRQLTLRHHPDVPGGSAETMKTLLAHYEILKNHFQAKEA